MTAAPAYGPGDRATQSTASSRHTVRALLSAIRRRWRRRTLIRGGSLTLLCALFLATVLILALVLFPMTAAQAAVAGGVGALIVAAISGRFVIAPMLRPPSDTQLALFVEEQIPDLEDRFIAAVEVDTGGLLDREHSRLLDRLIDDAVARARRVQPATVVDRSRERWLVGVSGALLLVFLLFGFGLRNRVQFTDGALAVTGVRLAQPVLAVEPGSVEIEKGGAQEVIARLRDAGSRPVSLMYREGDQPWQEVEMEAGQAGENVFLYQFFDVQQPIEYFVAHGELRSEPYRITLYEYPAVDRIDVAYQFPAYTGLSPETQAKTGDLRAVRGTRAHITVQTTGTTRAARLVLDLGEPVQLKNEGEGRFAGTLTLTGNGAYRFALEDANGRANKFPDEYLITVDDDRVPEIRVDDPGRDIRANAVEEIAVSATISDDYGVKDASLVYVVNGGEEQRVPLTQALSRTTREAGGEQVFFLEDYGLEPGDIISYYVQARDHFHPDPVDSDMYFIEVIPFDQQFRQVNNTGGGGGGAGGGIVMSQREIIDATWRLTRDWRGLDAAGRTRTSQAVAQAQANLKGEIEQRINETAFSLELQTSEQNRGIAEHLRTAVEEMTEAVSVLESLDPRGAMTPERRALNALLKADALNKEQQVGSGRQQGGGGGGAQERISELMDLELDISKDKYETRQQNAPGGAAADEELNEALRLAKELATKQQNLADQGRSGELEGEDKKRFVDQLRRDQESLNRQTESLSNMLRRSRDGQASSPESRARLDRVARNMREAEKALADGNIEGAMARQQQAINELDALQQELGRTTEERARDRVEDLARTFDDFRAQEQRLAEDIDRTTADARATGEVGRGELESLESKRAAMIDRLDDLVSEANTTARAVQDESPELATTLRNAVRDLRRGALEENMERSREALRQGWLDYAQRVEQEILSSVDRLESLRRAFDQALPVEDADRIARSLQDARELMQQMEDVQARRDRMDNARQRDGEPGTPDAQQGDADGPVAAPANGRADEALLRRQMERAQQTLERLQQGLQGSSSARPDLEALARYMGRADNRGVRLEGAAADRYFENEAYAALSRIEEDLARALDRVKMDKKLFGARRGDVPPAYRDLVDRYYESLSKDNER